MITRLLAPILCVAFLSGTAAAAGQPYDAKSFATLQHDGKSILVHVHATWCPTCKAQDPIVTGLLKDKRFQEVHGVEVDFDTQKELLKTWHVANQSTLIVFKGDKEIARSVGDTRPASIEALMQKAL